MSPAKIHMLDRAVARPGAGAAGGRLLASGAEAAYEATGLRLAATPLSDPAETFRRMPANVASPALFELIELISSPILLVEDGPIGEIREMPAWPAVPAAA